MSKSLGPYSPVRQAGNFYYVSGQVGIDQHSMRASSQIKDQVRQALQNLEAVLLTVNLELHDVVKTTIFVTDMSTFAVINAVYEQFFEEPRPARSTVEVSALPKVATNNVLQVEIEAIAYKEPA